MSEPNNTNGITVTDILAILGTITAAVALTWNIIRDRKDRGQLHVEALFTKKIPPVDSIPTAPHGSYAMLISITNTGRRPMYARAILVRSKKADGKEKLLSPDTLWQLPRMLKESEEITIAVYEFAFLSDDVISVFVSDSRGKDWYISKENLKQVLSDYRRMKK